MDPRYESSRGAGTVARTETGAIETPAHFQSRFLKALLIMYLSHPGPGIPGSILFCDPGLANYLLALHNK